MRLVLEDDRHAGATRVLSRRLRRRHEELRGDPGQVAVDDWSAKAAAASTAPFSASVP